MKIFVSYCSLDAKEIGINIKKHLERVLEGDVFLSENDIHAGDEWEQVIENNLKKCKIFLIIVTPGVLYSEYIKKKEIPKAIEFEKTVIPCRDSTVSRQEMEALLGIKKIQEIEFDSGSELLRKLVPQIKSIRSLRVCNVIDEVVPKMKAEKNGGSPSDYSAGVVAERDGDTIIFRSVKYGTPGRTITREQFERLDAQSYETLLDYEESMLKQFRRWGILHKTGKYYTDRKTRDEVNVIIHGICSDWNKIISHLGRFSIGLDDHYPGIYGICSDYGYVQERIH